MIPSTLDGKLEPEKKKKIIRELMAFLQDECETELSEFRAEMLVDLVHRQIFAEVYNDAILDARAFLSERLEDMEATLFARPPEPT